MAGAAPQAATWNCKSWPTDVLCRGLWLIARQWQPLGVEALKGVECRTWIWLQRHRMPCCMREIDHQVEPVGRRQH
ncbi:hypothetical protein [Dankookia sp. P2]|uniref:hypothetical protein n=1 Tax=Dankookia sp. P2 TaxID=3423955 RepID=UPI003D6655D0